MFFYSDDPVRDAERYMEEMDRRLVRFPVCCECDEPIQDEHCYEFDGEYICPSCLEAYHRKRTEDCI